MAILTIRTPVHKYTHTFLRVKSITTFFFFCLNTPTIFNPFYSLYIVSENFIYIPDGEKHPPLLLLLLHLIFNTNRVKFWKILTRFSPSTYFALQIPDSGQKERNSIKKRILNLKLPEFLVFFTAAIGVVGGGATEYHLTGFFLHSKKAAATTTTTTLTGRCTSGWLQNPVFVFVFCSVRVFFLLLLLLSPPYYHMELIVWNTTTTMTTLPTTSTSSRITATSTCCFVKSNVNFVFVLLYKICNQNNNNNNTDDGDDDFVVTFIDGFFFDTRLCC